MPEKKDGNMYIYADDNKNIKKEFNPGKRPEWVNQMIQLKASGMTYTEIGKIIHKHPQWLRNVGSFPSVKKSIAEEIKRRQDVYEKQVFNLITDSIAGLKDLINNSSDDKVKLDAIKTVLEKYNLVGNDVKTINTNDSTKIQINFINKENEDQCTRNISATTTG